MADSKKDQVNAMKDYIGGCQGFFERVLTDILLRQPADPHAFMLETLNSMTAEEKAQWQQKVHTATSGKGDESGLDMDTKEAKVMGPLPSTAVQVVLTLNVESGDDNKQKCLDVMREVREQGIQLAGCLSYQIMDKVNEPQVVVLQTWTDQAALDNYHAQSFFQEATPKFAGVLSETPIFNTYSPCS